MMSITSIVPLDLVAATIHVGTLKELRMELSLETHIPDIPVCRTERFLLQYTAMGG